MYVLDASPLVVLATAERLDLLSHFDACTLTDRVYEEVVVAGREHGHADAHRIDRAIDDGLLTVRPVGESSHFETFAAVEGLSAADASTLALAADRDATAVMDEVIGREVADAHGIETHGTAYLVLSLVRNGVFSVDEGRSVIDDLVEAGWYCSTDLYRRIERKLSEFESAE